jgi:hypothetical protein
MAGQEESGEAEDQDQPGDDEAESADERADGTAKTPGAEDGQLGRGRSGKQVGGCDPVLEVARREPAPVGDAEAAEQGDVGRRSAEADAADARPLPGDHPEGNTPLSGGGRPGVRGPVRDSTSVAGTARRSRTDGWAGEAARWNYNRAC